MTLFGDRVWLMRDVKGIAGAAQDARFGIEQRVLNKKATLDDGTIGWGQYLDDVHFSPNQWGLLGTSAGFQVLARVEVEGTAVPELGQVRPLLPGDISDLDALHPAVRAKAAPPKNDFENIVRLAFIAEALAADKPGTILQAPHPQIVEFIFSRARHERSWNPRSAQDGGVELDGHPVTTAFILHALRRYEDDHARFRPFRVWLARQLLNDAKLRARPDYLALVGLALTAPEWDADNPEDVRTALTRCREGLLNWRRDERTLVIDRPLFEGYQLGTTTDYLIFNPELMAALFFLRNGNPRPSRGFVATVTREVAWNVQANHGFDGQLGMMPTVDQEWASRVLQLFTDTYRDKSRRHLLLPGHLTDARVRLAAYLVILLVLVAVLYAIGQKLVAVIVFVLGAAVNAATLLLQKPRDDD